MCNCRCRRRTLWEQEADQRRGREDKRQIYFDVSYHASYLVGSDRVLAFFSFFENAGI